MVVVVPSDVDSPVWAHVDAECRLIGGGVVVVGDPDVRPRLAGVGGANEEDVEITFEVRRPVMLLRVAASHDVQVGRDRVRGESAAGFS